MSACLGLMSFLSMISADFKNTRLSLVSSMNEPLHNELVVQKLGGNEVTRNKLRILNCILSSFSRSSIRFPRYFRFVFHILRGFEIKEPSNGSCQFDKQAPT